MATVGSCCMCVALLQFFIRDILGMAGGIVFAYAAGARGGCGGAVAQIIAGSWSSLETTAESPALSS